MRSTGLLFIRRGMSTTGGKVESDLLVLTRKNGVTTLRMNRPKQLNAWSMQMMLSIRKQFKELAGDDQTKVLVLTGTDPYYCAGVNLSSTMKPMHPKELVKQIKENNEGIFNDFLCFPKPILISINGPAIGACVTSATLCDAIIASDKATFSTPFARLGIVPEGCSSVHFPRLLGPENANRMLKEEGWSPNADEALKIGLVQHVVPHEKLAEETQKLAEKWIKDNKPRTFNAGANIEEYKLVNKRETVELANAFMDVPFLQNQYNFLKSKKKTSLAMAFKFLIMTRPIWKKML